MRTSGIGISIFLIAVGAVMAWALEVDAEGINLNTVGIILLVVGTVGLVISAALSIGDRTTVERDREVVVDRTQR